MGPIETLHSPFSNPMEAGAMMYSFAGQQDAAADAARPCTRAQSGSAVAVSYAELDRGMLPASSDSGTASGGETVLMAAPAKEKKKVGRPITYKGDVNSKDLTEAERRRIKRRVANRESARRVRQKRQETMEEMQSRMDAMQQQTAALSARLQEVEQHKAMLLGQLTQMRDKWSAAVNENVRLQDEVTRGSGPLETSSARSSGTEADFCGPSVPVAPVSPPAHLDPDAAFMPASRGNAGGGGAITSGQPTGLCIPSVTSSTQISGFRPGVTITSVVRGFGGQQHGSMPLPQHYAQLSGPMAAPVSAAPPSSGGTYSQVPQAMPPPASQEAVKAEVPQMDSMPSLKDPLEWFLRQTSLEPLNQMLDDPNLLKGL